VLNPIPGILIGLLDPPWGWVFAACAGWTVLSCLYGWFFGSSKQELAAQDRRWLILGSRAMTYWSVEIAMEFSLTFLMAAAAIGTRHLIWERLFSN
jgi:hypothetical protein